jgi:hypothetical protein
MTPTNDYGEIETISQLNQHLWPGLHPLLQGKVPVCAYCKWRQLRKVVDVEYLMMFDIKLIFS